jgi:hypothetical protein
MFRLHSNRQITVASVLLLLLAAFAIDPPEHRCRTQSTRNRQSRVVRLDDGDAHSRWHYHGFNASGSTTPGDPLPAALAGPVILHPQFAVELLATDDEYVRDSYQRNGPRRSRPPPSIELA